MEREALGRAVAALPVSIGWEIRHTLSAGEHRWDSLPFIAACDLYVVLLGADFAAPMGSEWRQAMESRRLTLPFFKDISHSPSAQWALRQRDVPWEVFASAGELEALLIRRLARAVLERGGQLGLDLDDVEGLLALAGKQEEERTHEPDRRSGAGRSGMILGRDGVDRDEG
jgi:hypothetical protein